MRYLRFLFLITWLLAGCARAEFLLVPETRTVAPGGRVEITLFIPNDASGDRTFELPARLTLRPHGAPDGPEVVLEAVEPRQTSVQLAPGRFHRARYAGTLPDGLTGEILLEPVDFEGSPLALRTVAPEAPPPAAEAPAAQATRAALELIPRLDPDTARFVTAFSPHEPNYFSGGSRGNTNAKYQVSLKFRFFNPNTKTPFLEKLYLGYSQTSIWDLSSSSKPFRDSSYRPSLFFLDDKVSQWPFKETTLGFQGGFEHESNGKEDANSRSINIVFVRPTVTYAFDSNYFISVSPKFYGYLDKEENPDISDYRGYADFLIRIGETDGWQLASTLRKGTRSDAYSFELNLSYPLKKPTFGNLGGYLHLQYFNGYGEGLIDYNSRFPPQFRVGLMISR